MTVKLTQRDLETLNEIVPACSDEPNVWCRPMDVGGGNGSHHSATLMKLYRAGLVDAKQRGSSDEDMRIEVRYAARGSRVYRANAAGIARIEMWRGPRRTRAEQSALISANIARAEARRGERGQADD